MIGRLPWATLAIASIIAASVIIGGACVLAGGMLYVQISAVTTPTMALICTMSAVFILGAVLVLCGHIALTRAMTASVKASSQPLAGQAVADALLHMTKSNPTKLLLISLGVGIVLGANPRLRQVIYRALMR